MVDLFCLANRFSTKAAFFSYKTYKANQPTNEDDDDDDDDDDDGDVNL